MTPYRSFLIFLQSLRDFFREEDFLEIPSPVVVPHPGIETHIHPFGVYSLKDKSLRPLYLQTSPEFYMKKLLSLGYEKIFALSPSFRDEPYSPHHHFQFLMLEWYRSQVPYEKIMQDLTSLLTAALKTLQEKKIPTTFERITPVTLTVQEACLKFAKFDVLNFLEREDLRALMQTDFPDLLKGLPEDSSWEDLFFQIFLNRVEPEFRKIDYLLLTEYPAPLSALARLKPEDPRVCLRFEAYLRGVEICNCFQELTDLTEQKKRAREELYLKEKFYGITLPEPTPLYQTLERGLPDSSGVALGIERVFSLLTGQKQLFVDDLSPHSLLPNQGVLT